MADIKDLYHEHKDLPADEQVKAGKAIGGDMSDEHADFLKTLIKLIDSKKITLGDTKSFLNADVYEKLPQESQDKVDLAILNVADQLRLINDFYRSEATPDSSPHLQTMIEQLWQMKSRLEEQLGDVFKF